MIAYHDLLSRDENVPFLDFLEVVWTRTKANQTHFWNWKREICYQTYVITCVDSEYAIGMVIKANI